MFRSPTITTLDRFHLFLPLPLISAHSVLPVLKSTFNNSTSSPSARHSPPAIRHFPITGPICAKRPSREAGGLSPRVSHFFHSLASAQARRPHQLLAARGSSSQFPVYPALYPREPIIFCV